MTKLFSKMRMAFPDLDRQYSPRALKEIFDKTLGDRYRFIPAVFYCGWAGLETGEELNDADKAKLKSYYPCCCFNHYIGMPTLKLTDKVTNITYESAPLEFNSYQKPWIKELLASKGFFSLLKTRGAGATEVLTIRWFLFRAILNSIKERKFIIIAGTSSSLAIELLVRMKVYLDRRPSMYREVPKSQRPEILKVGCSNIMAFPTDTEAIRGLENVELIALEEPGSWDLVNDQPVLDAAEPLVAKSGATIVVNGTARGKRGFFWHKIWDPSITSLYHKIHTFVDEVLNAEHPLLDAQTLAEEKAKDPVKFAQEYEGSFNSPEGSLFGPLTEKNLSDDFEGLTL